MTTRDARQSLAVLGLMAAFVATVATSRATPTTSQTSATGTILLTRDSSVAMERFVVSVPGLVSANRAIVDTTFELDQAEAQGPDGQSIASSDGISLRVQAIDPAAEEHISLPPANGGSQEPGNWAVPATSGSTLDLRVDCSNVPITCDRPFRVVATLKPGAESASITWHIAMTLAWEEAVPSNANASIRVDQAIPLVPHGGAIDTGLKAESVTLGSDVPAHARLIEVRFDPGTLDYVPQVGLSSSLTPGRDPNDPPAILDTYQIMPPAGFESYGLGSTSPDAALDFNSMIFPSPTSSSRNLLEGCDPGRVCVRRILARLTWQHDPTADYTWSVSATRLDLDRALAETSNPISIQVIQDLDPLKTSPAKLHLEGDMTVVDTSGSKDLHFCVAGKVAPASPAPSPLPSWNDTLWGWLPVPAVARFSVTTPTPLPDGYVFATGMTVYAPGSRTATTAKSLVPIEAGLLAGARDGVDQDIVCGDLDIAIQDISGGSSTFRSPKPSWVAHWALDLTVYGYEGESYTITAGPNVP